MLYAFPQVSYIWKDVRHDDSEMTSWRMQSLTRYGNMITPMNMFYSAYEGVMVDLNEVQT